MTARHVVLGMGLGLLALLFASCATDSGTAPQEAADGDTAETDDALDGDTTEAEAESDPNDVSQVRRDYPDSQATPNEATKIEYLIVAPASMYEAYAPLVAWKNAKGVASTIAVMEDIQQNQTGRDAAEKLRNYLKELHAKQPLHYVLLGADTPFVPHREFFVHVDVAGQFSTEGNVAADLYFADLDGSWDANNNGIYGEMDDGLGDLVPELAVSRAPMRTAEEAAGFVAKVLAYEQTPPAEFINQMLFLSEDTGYGVDSAVAFELMVSSLPKSLQITKLYSVPSSDPSVILNTREAELDLYKTNPPHVTLHFGHGSVDTFAFLDVDDALGLSNGPKNTIFISTACDSGGFNRAERSGAEAFMVNAKGGGLAYFGNTEIGIGFPSGMQFIRKYVKNLYDAKAPILHLADGFNQARLDMAPASDRQKENDPARWTNFTLVLFGDPEMRVWTAEPRALALDAPSGLHTGKNAFRVRVTKDGEPQAGALVTAYVAGQLLARVESDAKGLAAFQIELTQTATALTLTADKDFAKPAGRVLSILP